MTEPKWKDFEIVADPRLGQAVTLLSPALTINFFLQWIDADAVRELYDKALELVRPSLTHYIADNMQRPEKITDRALGMIPAWMRKPREVYAYEWNAYSGDDLGCAGPGIEFFLGYFSPPPEASMRNVLRNAKAKAAPDGEIAGYHVGSAIRVLLPVDHALGHADALRDWLCSLSLLKKGRFNSVECSYGLSAWGHLSNQVEKRQQALCSRYPGLDSYAAWQSGQVRVDLNYPDLIPLVKRAAWTNVLHELTVRALGGAEAIIAKLADTPEIRVTPFEHGLMLQAGEHPELGDLNRGELLPLLRKVASVLKPVRVNLLPEIKGEFWDHFFNIFDKTYD
jgi:Protein of unknown function (DUF3396)